MSETKSPTRGPWIVGTNIVKGSPDRRIHICVVRAEQPNKIIALTGIEGAPDEAESIANAALIAIAPDMLEALIAIQETLMTSKQPIDLEAMNTMISEVFAKLANEAGEEL
jgi:hypothetical protein